LLSALSYMPSFDWDSLTKSQKIVKTKDERSCGNLMAEYKDNIIIIEGSIKSHEYMIPKSKVADYNGNEIYLDVSYDMLSSFEF
jgi:hypothetical protein